MKKCKRLMCFVLAALMILSINVPAFAIETQENSNSADNGKPLAIEVTTNKSEYSTLGVAKIDVTITNTSSEEIQNVSAEAVFKQLAPAGWNSETKKEVDTLKAGESISFSYKATLNKEEYKLNIFEKVFLWLVRLFNGGFTAKDNGFDDGREYTENVTTIKFGKVTADSIVRVWYGETAYLSTKDAKDMKTVDSSLSQLMSSEAYKNKEQKGKINLVKKQLSTLEKDGLIETNSINYNETTKVFHFNYACGISSCVVIKEQKKYSDPWLNPISLTDNNYSETSIRQRKTTTNKSSDISESINSVLMYGFDEKQYELIDGSWRPVKRELSNWIDICNNKQNMNTAVYDCPTIYDFKTALNNMDFICIFQHGDYGVIVEDTYVFQVMGEEVTENTDLAYDTDIYFKRIGKFTSDDGTHYYITPKFFEFYYNNKLNDSIVYLISCQGFGEGSSIDYGIADTFIEKCGAKAVLGFYNSVAQCYAYWIYDQMTNLLLNGSTVGEAYDYTVDKLGPSDASFLTEYLFNIEDMSVRREWLEAANEKIENGTAATFLLYGDENANFNIKSGTVSGFVRDGYSNKPIKDVDIEVIINDTSGKIKTTTDSDGKFSIRLPYGSYSVSFNHDNYEYHGISLNVYSDYVVLSEPILLTPKNTNIPSTAVEFNGHYYQVYDESMTWTEAKKYCGSLGGHLATITSQEEQQFIESQLVNGQKSCYWLGGTDSAVEGKWNWITGEEFSYTKWGADMPDNWQDEDYLMIYKDPHPSHTGNTFGFWNDLKENGTCQGTSYFKKEVFGFVCEWDEFTHETPTASNCITKRECVDYGWYTGNMGDSCLFSLDKQGIYNDNADNSGYYRNGNIGLDGTEYNNGFEAWIARWNPTAEISWAYATYKLEGKYKKLTGKTSLIQSANTNNFNTTVYFYNGDTLLQSYVLKNDDYEKDIDVDVTGVDELKILVKDNVAVKGGTSFALYDMFLN